MNREWMFSSINVEWYAQNLLEMEDYSTDE